MKKQFFKVIALTLSMIGIIFVPTFASDISEQIENAKCVTEYPSDTDFDDFDTVTFGRYPIYAEVGTSLIEWFVLEKQKDRALLISKYVLDWVYNRSDYGITPDSDKILRKVKTFYSDTFPNVAFNNDDAKYITNVNGNGKVYMLSSDELIKYFGIYKKDDTKIWLDSNAAIGKESPMLENKDGKNASATLWFGRNNSNYFTLWYDGGSPGQRYPTFKQIFDGEVGEGLGWAGLRPAIWVSLSDNGNQNSRNTNNFATQQNNTGKDSNTIAGLPSVQSEYRNDGHFYLNNNMQKSTWVYYVTYYYHVDGAGNIEKSKWIEQRYVGADGRMYRGRQTPDGKWVGNDGLVVNVSQDLSHSLTIEAAEPDSWYKTQSGLWYYFENDRTTTKKGWFTDARDNQTYYLYPSTGIMAVGWTTINGSLYYFNESHDNVKNWYETGGGFYESYGKKTKAYGSMFRNEKTPDGYQVDANGKIIN